MTIYICLFGSATARLSVPGRWRRQQICSTAIVARNRLLFDVTEVEGTKIDLREKDSRAKHIRQVLKATEGETLRVGVINGWRANAVISDISNNSLSLLVQNWHPPLPSSGVCLLLAMPRPKVLKRLWSILPTLAVDAVYITGAERVEKVYYGAQALKPDVVYQEVVAGLEQASNTRLPSIVFTKSLAATVALVSGTKQPAELYGFQYLVKPGHVMPPPYCSAKAVPVPPPIPSTPTTPSRTSSSPQTPPGHANYQGVPTARSRDTIGKPCSSGKTTPDGSVEIQPTIQMDGDVESAGMSTGSSCDGSATSCDVSTSLSSCDAPVTSCDISTVHRVGDASMLPFAVGAAAGGVGSRVFLVAHPYARSGMVQSLVQLGVPIGAAATRGVEVGQGKDSTGEVGQLDDVADVGCVLSHGLHVPAHTVPACRVESTSVNGDWNPAVLAAGQGGGSVEGGAMGDCASGAEVVIAIGPEGGWTVDELLLFESSGFVCVSMGDHVMTTTTAVIAALSAVRGYMAG